MFKQIKELYERIDYIWERLWLYTDSFDMMIIRAIPLLSMSFLIILSIAFQNPETNETPFPLNILGIISLHVITIQIIYYIIRFVIFVAGIVLEKFEKIKDLWELSKNK